jgi:hypothetical protein
MEHYNIHLAVFQPYTLIWWLIFPRSRYTGMAITHGESIDSLTGWKVTQWTESNFSQIHFRKQR